MGGSPVPEPVDAKGVVMLLPVQVRLRLRGFAGARVDCRVDELLADTNDCEGRG